MSQLRGIAAAGLQVVSSSNSLMSARCIARVRLFETGVNRGWQAQVQSALELRRANRLQTRFGYSIF